MIKPIALSATHMECQNLKETVPVLTDLLAFEKLAEGPGEVKLKHPNTPWLLYVHETGGEAATKQMHNHWGVRVATTGEVDAAYDYLASQPGKVRYQANRPSRFLITDLTRSIFSSREPTAGKSSATSWPCARSRWLGKPAASTRRIGPRPIRPSDLPVAAMFPRLLPTEH